MLRASFLAVAIGVIGCSTPSKPPISTTGSTGVPPGGGEPSNEDGGVPGTCSFPSSPASFALPTIAGAQMTAFTDVSSNTIACASGSGKLVYSLADMNADGQPDLIVTSACEDATVGASVWLVYANTGSGFSTTPIRFALAPATSPAGCATASIFDIDGDLLPDYVVTALCNDSTVGSSRWLVHTNIQTGFAATPVPYPLPPGYSKGAFLSTAATVDVCTGATNLPAFELFDINGDAVPDFVLMQSCGDASIGTVAWKVYFGTLAGAAQTPTSFPLPTTPTVTSGAFGTIAGTLSCTAKVTEPGYALLDFDVDGKVDIVVTRECSDATVGTSTWLWYRNSGQSFAPTPATVSLPTIAGVPAGSFSSLSSAGQCAKGAGAPTYTVADVDGNAVLDLLVTRDCGDPLTGASYWQVFANNAGLGFTSPHRQLMLPSALGATLAAPVGLTGALDCTPPSRPAFTAAYLAGLKLDLVVTSLCNDATVGGSRWLLFPPTCP